MKRADRHCGGAEITSGSCVSREPGVGKTEQPARLRLTRRKRVCLRFPAVPKPFLGHSAISSEMRRDSGLPEVDLLWMLGHHYEKNPDSYLYDS